MLPSSPHTTDTLLGLTIVVGAAALILPLFAALAFTAWGLAAHAYHWMQSAF